MSFDKIFDLTAAAVYFYFFSTYLDPRLADRLCLSVCKVIMERLAEGILGVKHGVAAFVIQSIECCYNNAATCCCRLLSSGRWNISSTQYVALNK